ncbi:MAG: LPS export ABC transporter permease LptG [Alphaproteobacteria bacterium]
MTLPFRLFRYFGWQVLRTVLVALFAIACLILLIDAVEMLRQHASRDRISGLTAVGLSLLKLPGLMEKVFPFLFLIATMWTFSRLSRNQELVIARASGVSVWGILLPAIVVAFLCGTVVVALFNPVSAMTQSRYAYYDATLLKGRGSTLALSKNGLWMRQATDGEQAVIHALKAAGGGSDGVDLQDVIIWRFESGRSLPHERIEAASAILRPRYWELHEAWRTVQERQPEFHPAYLLPTNLTPERIEESFAPPETLSFWDLPDFIHTAEQAGFSATRYRLHWQKVLSTPFFLCAMVFVAATFSLKSSRSGGMVRLVVAGALTGFALFFVSDVASALGQSGVIPVTLAAWSPTLVASLLGATMLLHLEDG